MAKANEKEYLTPTRTELVWPGKRTQVERIALPFQVVETVNQSRATREQTPMLASLPAPPLFEARPGTSWKNKLIWGENKYVMASLLQGDPSIGLEPLAGKVDLIYIDPPFATGQGFSINMQVGDAEWTKEASIIEEKAYRDTWGTWPRLDSYLQMMYERITLIKELLSPRGNLVVHIDYRLTGHMRLLLDELFARERFCNEIIWNKGFRGTRSNGIFQHAHDTLWWYKSGEVNIWNQTFEPYKDEDMGRYNQIDENGNQYALIKRRRTDGTIYYGRTYPGEAGKWRNDVISDVPTMAATSSERLGFDTQKPEDLIDIIVGGLSAQDSIVADFFCGSGTTMSVAEKLGRRWIGCDLSRFAIQVSRKRLLNIADCQPFEVLNLGKYERKHWQVNVLNGEQEDGSKAIADYLRFIVALYHAEPVEGYAHLHGQKAGHWVHVGATDASVTRDEVMEAVRECQANRYTALDVLGWEWEMGLHDTARDEAKRMGVDVRLLYIPREVMDKRAVEAGDVHFYELAYLKTSLLQDGRTVTVRLDDFIIPNPDLVPDDVRRKVKKWSDYIDFWAVDWNYAGDTFHNEWQTYRTRKSPTLRLISDPHTYPEPGKYRILVKVIDIFGNDTTQLLEVAVS